ncbi:MAG: DUF3048 domain-containing protein [Patescibacteria group bacterium]
MKHLFLTWIRNPKIIIATACAFLVVVFFLFFNSVDIPIIGGGNGGVVRSGETACAAARPWAVMLSGDALTRPLSGIASASVVFEMPVTPNGVTRTMAIFCNLPERIGSVRSVRAEFVPFVSATRSILVHWGGEAGALDRVRAQKLDRVDGMLYDGIYFTRSQAPSAPHNGFTSASLLKKAAEKLGIPTSGSLGDFPRGDVVPQKSLGSLVSRVDVPYLPPFDVSWAYDATTKRYARARNGAPEVDGRNGGRVFADAVVTVRAPAEQLRDQYLSIALAGERPATVYQAGTATSAIWSLEGDALTLLGVDRKPLTLQYGVVWIQIIPEGIASTL